MKSMVFKAARAAFDALAEVVDEPVELLSTDQRLDQLERIHTLQQILPAPAHELINELVSDFLVLLKFQLSGRLPVTPQCGLGRIEVLTSRDMYLTLEDSSEHRTATFSRSVPALAGIR